MQVILSRLVLITIAIAGGCTTPAGQRESKQSASIVEYLYPAAAEAPKMEPGVALLRPPVRVGLAFVPANAKARTLSEVEKMKLLERTKAAFARQPYVGAIEIIPTQYLRAGGGFDNLQQVSRLFNVDIMAMVSYDQVHFTDTNSLAFLYWTIVGAYVVNGNEFDIKTMLDISVFDVASRKLLFRAPGTSQVNGGSNWANYSERARAAQIEGYQKAVDQLIPQLNAEIESFRERLKSAVDIKLAPKPGYQVGDARK
ncbi:MAG: rhombotarget lipoprotein [Betaproteobacteria bacterium]